MCESVTSRHPGDRKYTNIHTCMCKCVDEPWKMGTAKLGPGVFTAQFSQDDGRVNYLHMALVSGWPLVSLL